MATALWEDEVRSWRRAIVRLRRSQDLQEILAQMPQRLDGCLGCGLYRIDDGHTVRFNALRQGDAWTEVRTLEALGRLGVWKKGRARRVQAEREDPALGLRLGVTKGWIVEVPFDAGVLIAALDEAAEPTSVLERLEALAADCDLLFCRLADIERLEEREEQLRQAQKLAMVGQLSAGVIHEVNNALTVVLGQSELMQLEATGKVMTEGLDMVCRAGRNAQKIIGRMLEMTHQREAPRMYFDFNALIEQTVQLVQRQLLRKNIHLQADLAEGLPQAFGVPEQIQQVVLNLIQNGSDAILSIRRHGTIRVRTRLGGRYAVVEVEDDGPGIPHALQQRVFEPFVTTKEKGKGTGLGLSVCQSIARDHQGMLWVGDVEDGTGTRMVLELPLDI